MKAKSILMFGCVAMLLLAFALAASATTEITVPANINGSVSNSSSQVITVAIAAKATTLNFTQLNISYSTRGGANVTLIFINVSNATTDTISAPGLNLRTLPEGVLDILVKACNGTACGVGTGNQNGTMNVQLNPPGVTTVSPLVDLEDTTIITVTPNESARCAWSLNNNVGYRNLTTNLISGNGTSLNLTSPLSEDSDRTFYFSCEDEFQNSGPSSEQRLFHKGRSNIAIAGAVSAGLINTQQAGAVASGGTVQGSTASLSLASSSGARKIAIGVLVVIIAGLAIWLLWKALK